MGRGQGGGRIWESKEKGRILSNRGSKEGGWWGVQENSFKWDPCECDLAGSETRLQGTKWLAQALLGFLLVGPPLTETSFSSTTLSHLKVRVYRDNFRGKEESTTNEETGSRRCRIEERRLGVAE
eukprot:TRINITY_DN13685_c0_g2_i1.p1 TRINITY_DN13685_c0_g2~~TRINITY_DN13685_c0_g2_i1.p1  ORF type:complete len:125 (+),score=15.68 TRINITY_DN13685_c0_g2_i1:92-466(+)